MEKCLSYAPLLSFKEWFSAEHINRGLLVKEWAERLKNKPAPVKKTGPHKVIVDEVNKPERPRRSENRHTERLTMNSPVVSVRSWI